SIFLGTVPSTSNALGLASFSFAAPVLSAGRFVAATAVRATTGDTSEFSPNFAVTAPGALNGSSTAFTTTSGTPVAGVIASFVDGSLAAPGTYLAVIDWGDGHTTSGAVTTNASGGIDVAGSNSYTQPGNYAIGVGLSTADGRSIAARSAVRVLNAPLQASGTTVAPVEGTAFNCVVARF